MVIPKRALVDPAGNAVFAGIAVAVSLFVFAYSTRFGKVPILAFYLCWLPLLAVEPALLLRGAGRVAVFLALPALAALSAAWSDVPATTLRAAIQYGTTALCGLIAARVVAPETLCRGGLAGITLVLAYSFLNGRYNYDVVDGSYAFAGAFASKNQLGLFASLGLIFALGTVFLFRSGRFWKLAAACVAALSATALAMSASATSTITVAGAILAMGTGAALMALPPGPRRVAIAVAAVSIVVLALTFLVAGFYDHLFAAFGKDATLTGRTYLWREGVDQGHRNVLAGLGYYAFWVEGRPLAEELWRLFYITGRTGFHFHNTFIEVYVALGLAGLLMASALVAALVAMAFRVLMNRQRHGAAILCGALALMLVVRAVVEVDVFTPYTVGAFLFHYLLLQMSDQRAAERRQRRLAEAARGLPAYTPAGI